MKPIPFTVFRVWMLASLLGVLVFSALAADDPSIPGLTADEQQQNAISARLTKLSADRMDKEKPRMDRIVEDIQRTLKLPPERLEMLQIGAQGLLMKGQDNSAKNLVRDANNRLKGATPKTATKILASMGIPYGTSVKQMLDDPLWKGITEHLLSEDERKRWENVVAERKSYRYHAIAEFVLLSVQSSKGLSDDPATRLRPLMFKAAEEYMPDLLGSYGDGDGGGNFYVPYAQVLILAVPEDEAKAIVGEAQMSDWRGAAGEMAGEWKWMKDRHDQRIKKGAKK